MFQHNEGCYQTRIGAEVSSKVIVATVFTSKCGSGLGHYRLDVAVTDPRSDGTTPSFLDGFNRRSRANQVVQNGARPFAFKDCCSHQGSGERTAHRICFFVDQEDAIRVSVERKSNIGRFFNNLMLQIDQILLLDRISRVIGKAAV